MKTDDKILVEALRILVRDIQSDDGIANACIAEAAERLEELTQWRDISTAPKDGRSLRLKFMDGHKEHGAWRYSANNGCNGWGAYLWDNINQAYMTSCFLFFEKEPTHWMPPAPSQQGCE